MDLRIEYINFLTWHESENIRLDTQKEIEDRVDEYLELIKE